ncbi:hypothetical protein, partial [Mucilaginibacter sp. SG538B]|uniref:hypothetical protein n=1 Tax=unclassified Mucilaginibacter TaxID=2617802 RepID=UPI001C40408C
FALSSTLPFGSAKVENLFLFPKLFYFLFFKVLQCLSFFSFPLQHRFFYPLYELPLLFEAAAKVRISF